MSRPYVNLSLPAAGGKTGFLAHPITLRIIQDEYAHEVIEAVFPTLERGRKFFKEDTPVKITWGPHKGQTQTIAGTVHHANNRDEPEASNHTRNNVITFVGGTKKMNEKRGFSQYKGVPATTIAQRIVPKNGLSLHVEKHDFRWPILRQDGMSEWEFLTELGKKIGWTVYARNTDVKMHSRVVRPEGALRFKDRGRQQSPQPDAIRDFTVVDADGLWSGERKRTRGAYAIERVVTPVSVETDLQASVRNRLFYAQARPLKKVSGTTKSLPKYKEYRRHIRANSVHEARAILEGEQEFNRHHLKAKVTLTGDPRVHAGATIHLSDINKDHDGHWYVTRVEHIITETDYTMILNVGRDGLGDTEPDTGRSRRVVNDGTSAQNKSGPPGVYRGKGVVIPNGSAPKPEWRSTAPGVRTMPAARGPKPAGQQKQSVAELSRSFEERT